MVSRCGASSIFVFTITPMEFFMSEVSINEGVGGDYAVVAEDYGLAITINTKENTDYIYDQDAAYSGQGS